MVSFFFLEIDFECSILGKARYIEKVSDKISLMFDVCSKDIRFNNVHQFGETWENELMADPELMSPLFWEDQNEVPTYKICGKPQQKKEKGKRYMEKLIAVFQTEMWKGIP